MQILTQFQENPDAWTRVDKILESSTLSQTKFISLQILEKVIQTKWKIIPADQQNGIKNYIVDTIIKNSSSELSLKQNKLYLSKLNLILVQILKQEWPNNWPTFIPEIVNSSKTNISLCENNMEILKLLSEEVFDFSEEKLTQAKIVELKKQLNGEFSSIFQLCNEVLSSAMQPSLVKATLETLLRFLSWIPLGYIFETDLIDNICSRFLEARETRNQVYKCLTEISGLNIEEAHKPKIVAIFTVAMETLQKTFGLTKNFEEEWDNLDQDEQELIQNVVQFLSTILGKHLNLLEKSVSSEMIEAAHLCLVNIMTIDDREIFKVCLEYSLKFVKTLFDDSRKPRKESLLNLGQNDSGSRQNYYPGVLSALRIVVIDKMVKPEEVLIVENDDGEIVREFIKETDTINLYTSQRECLVYLTHLDSSDMENIMMSKLSIQLDLVDWSWSKLNSLCWAFGSISGSMSEDQERKFLVVVIKGLLGLCEMVKGKDNKAVVASNIMYVVGQYPRFLKAHWKFLKTVANKLFEFMHEMHPGVRDMACDTFIKLADKCKRHFIVIQSDETEPFINEIISTIDQITSDLEPQQTSTFFSAVARIVACQQDPNISSLLLNELMRLPNMNWEQVLKVASDDHKMLETTDVNKSISNILKINTSVCEQIGNKFLPQLAHIYMDMMGMYHAISALISSSIAANGEIAARYPNIRAMRGVKKDCLKLIETYISLCEDADFSSVCQNIIPTFFDVVTADYNSNKDISKDAGVLSCLSVMVKVLGNLLSDRIFVIFDVVFTPTLNMINKDFTEYPDHRTEFFSLLSQLVNRMFSSLLVLNPDNFKLLVDSIVWGFKHTTRDIADASLKILLELITSFSQADPSVANAFFQTFYIPLLQDILFVLTDSDHKSGFRSQCLVFSKLLEYIQSPIISVPILGNNSGEVSNSEFVFNYIVELLGNAFPNLNSMQLKAFVTDLTECNQKTEQFRSTVRDFLVKLNVFSGDNADLFLAERKHEQELLREAKRKEALAIPGMIKPSDMEDD
ncbi:Exportin-1 [Smittium culicis]|uniref:Exportin-1 n=1 Tax=Smittium culicis TaxID=133412 RepID=A0A1R1YTT5_9FUNG|nr:Exportin-1 [Smittium culicis]